MTGLLLPPLAMLSASFRTARYTVVLFCRLIVSNAVRILKSD